MTLYSQNVCSRQAIHWILQCVRAEQPLTSLYAQPLGCTALQMANTIPGIFICPAARVHRSPNGKHNPWHLHLPNRPDAPRAKWQTQSLASSSAQPPGRTALQMTSAIYSDIRPTEKHPEQTFQDLLRAYIISLFFHKVKQADLFHLKIRQHQSFHFLTFHMGCFHSLHAVADAGFE